MISPTDSAPRAAEKLNWADVVAQLAGKAVRRHLPLDRDELLSLAGLAAAKANAYYDQARATCSFRQWIYSQGWRLLLSEVRDELRRRRRSPRGIALSELQRACAARGQRAAELLAAGPVGAPLWRILASLLEGLVICPLDRRIVVLRVQRWTYVQIGRRCGLSGEAVRLRMKKVRLMLERRRRDV